MRSRRIRTLVSAATALLISSRAHAIGELRELYRDPSAQAMGNAVTAVADDAQALFYNPAALAGVKGSSFQIVNIDLTGSGDIYNTYKNSANTFKSLSPDTLNSLMGSDLFAQASASSMYVSKGFALAAFVDQQAAVYAKNQVFPQITLGYQTTSGVQFGYGLKLDRLSRGKNEFRIGMAGKFVFRRGGYPTLTISQMLNISQDEFHQIIGGFGHTFGADLGLQYIRKLNNRVDLLAGLDWANLGGLNFGNGFNQPDNLSFGLGVRYQYSKFRVTVSYDYRHITESTDWRMRNHLGLSIGLPLLDIYAGLNQAYPTLGVGFDIWIVRVTALAYEEELGSLLHQDPERRYEVRFSFGLGI